jgi:uncharacterized protein YlaI
VALGTKESTMQCNECEKTLSIKKKKPKLKFFGKESIIEFSGLLIIGFSSSYIEYPVLKFTLIVIGVVAIVYGHKLMNQKISFYYCEACKTDGGICT